LRNRGGLPWPPEPAGDGPGSPGSGPTGPGAPGPAAPGTATRLRTGPGSRPGPGAAATRSGPRQRRLRHGEDVGCAV
ncbi:MAG: hypothetical protein EON52_06980, partial [Actinomycetales bacterium]